MLLEDKKISSLSFIDLTALHFYMKRNPEGSPRQYKRESNSEVWRVIITFRQINGDVKLSGWDNLLTTLTIRANVDRLSQYS